MWVRVWISVHESSVNLKKSREMGEKELLRELSLANFLPHLSHSCGFSPVCVLSCTLHCPLVANVD